MTIYLNATATHDGAGNVTLYGVTATHDGAGNVTFYITDDGSLPPAIAVDQVTVYLVAEVKSVTRYYLLASEEPEKPTANPPDGWTDAEPTYDSSSDQSLYVCDLTVFTDGTWSYSNVGLSSGYSATKAVYEITQTNSTQITELLQTSEAFTMNFETIETTVTELNGVITTEQEERLKYIKFIDGEIWLGKDPEEGENDFKLRISNQRISFLLNNVEVAYFADDALHVETAYLYRAYVTKGLYIGGLLIEESSDGNVNARWVG